MLLVFAKPFPFLEKRRFNACTKSHNPSINLPIYKDMLFFFPITTICDHDLLFRRKDFGSDILSEEYISIQN